LLSNWTLQQRLPLILKVLHKQMLTPLFSVWHGCCSISGEGQQAFQIFIVLTKGESHEQRSDP
jgi:NADH:ubiquinone oxidoreductase subunit B-like Fe-S oxidoreductase